MEVYDLSILARDFKQDDLYDLFNKTYIDFKGVQFDEYIVQQDEEMRMDLICYRIYSSTEYIGFLCNYNGIENPLNVMQGDIIKYVDISDIDSFKYSLVKSEQVKQEILNADKGSRKDPTRKEFVEQGYSLPPNFNDTPQAPVQLVGDTLLIRS